MSDAISLNFSGAKGNQFGRKTYVTMVPFRSLNKFFTVFDEVQRSINHKKVKSIADYILKGFSDDCYSFISALTVSCRGEIGYDETSKQVIIDIDSSLSVNDGQHRLEGIKLALKLLSKEVDAATGEEKKRLTEKLNHFRQMTVPVVIYSDMTIESEQQLFHDLNLLSTKPNKSVSLKFDKIDLYNRMARELASENTHLRSLGVESEKATLKGRNKKFILLSTLREAVSYIVCGAVNDTDRMLTEENYDSTKEVVNEILNEVFSAIPIDCNDRSKYILGYSGAFQAIGKYIYYILNKENIANVTDYIAGLGSIDWRHQSDIWLEFGGKYDENRNRVFFSGNGSGMSNIFKALKKYSKLPM
ncbi:DNA sulfur modification protein DndB [Brevibacillus sp. HB2.2]|uniref:DNA sulfur modification protein DndB n=1 Tax=Brevibacillus sp. HB2.2 TaxID=2738846 RepID=UPI00156B9D0B|nr:DNA sulfur modification protein DndB [Brevibacillus sp. HB2.2]NRS52054.1 DGQHR domain-containing protein [Brevibacillus sp. HB2.2]